MSDFIFRSKGHDPWGNILVECPVCEFEFKKDGIRAHLLSMTDEKHKKWLQKYPWKRNKNGRPEPIKTNE